MSEINLENQKKEQSLDAVKAFILANGGIVKRNQFDELDIDYRRILDFVEKGELIRLKSGYYTVKGSEFSDEELLVKLFPDGVLSLESALYVYGYISEKPLEWRIAIDKNTSKSRFKSEEPKVIPMYAEPEVLESGVTKVTFGNGQMQIFEKERLICECLKYEDKMERAVFQEGLRSYIADEKKDFAKLIEYAGFRKVTKKVQNLIGVWLLAKEEKSQDLTEYLVQILHYLELLPSMEPYERAYEYLCKESLDGRRCCAALAGEWQKSGQEYSLKRGEILQSYEAYTYLEKRWKQHMKNRKGDEQLKNAEFPEWKEVCGKVNAFLLPMWKSLCADEIFFGDWMPDLGRYLQ